MRRDSRARGTPVPAVALLCLVTITMLTVVALGLTSRPTRTARTTWAAASDAGTARGRLAALHVVQPSPEVAYDRVRDFGPAWSDVDHNGCDTRNDILQRDLTEVTFTDDPGGCVVASGRMVEPYTGAHVTFSRSDPTTIQIDHLVPLHAAWALGAWAWEPELRTAFANDPVNLVAVDGPANQAKSDSLVDRWRPDNEAVHCVYAVNTVDVHHRYGLGVTTGERRALAGMLDRCG